MINKIINNKIKTISDLSKIIESLRITDEKIVFTNGCFDIIHSGHIHSLAQN